MGRWGEHRPGHDTVRVSTLLPCASNCSTVPRIPFLPLVLSRLAPTQRSARCRRGRPSTRCPLLTPWRAALKGPIHLWRLKAPLSQPGGSGARGLGSEGRNAPGEIAPGLQSPDPHQISTRTLVRPRAGPPPPAAPRCLRASPTGGGWAQGKPRLTPGARWP